MFKNKTIVICQSALHFLSGSEIVTLELADYFKSCGAKVIVFTWFLSDPIKTEFDKRGITVTTDSEDKKLLKANLVWVHHQAIPKIILENIKTLDIRFLFFHMSAKEDIYLEQPYIYGLEEKLASKSLFVSEEALEFGTTKYPSLKKRAGVLRNWSPENFCNFRFEQSDELKRVLVVSNHTPKEVVALKEAFASRGIVVDYVGSDGECRLVTPEILARANVVVTIGKTVQYCLSMGIPVYIYDHFGGPGYLNKTNYEKVRKLNFSGRGSKTKSTETIVEEILSGYKKAKEFQTNNRESFISDFGINKTLDSVFNKLDKRDFSKIDGEYLSAAIGALWLVRERCVADNRLVDSLEENREVRAELEKYSSAYASLKNSKTIKIAESIKRLGHLARPSCTDQQNKPLSKKYKFLKTTNAIPNPTIVGILLERNESLLLKDTLNEMAKLVDAIIVVDDASTDNSVDIALANKKTVLVLKNRQWQDISDRSSIEGQHRQAALIEAKRLNPKWIVCLDADERVENPEKVREFMLDNIENDSVSGLRFSLFDAYMTDGDQAPYLGGPLYNFRKMFGRERRDIPMAWKSAEEVYFPSDGNAARVPIGIDDSRLVTKFYVQHYGKSLSIQHWEETCDFYVSHFPEYAEKWRARKGKAVHDKFSDFGTDLMTWEDVKKDGGILIG